MTRTLEAAPARSKAATHRPRLYQFRLIDRNGAKASQFRAFQSDGMAIDYGWDMVAGAQFPAVQVWRRDGLVGILERASA
jgi:hypothetical protein